MWFYDDRFAIESAGFLWYHSLSLQGGAIMKLMILDGNSILNRAFYGVRILTTKEGLCTNAIFGFLNILERLRKEETPDALCVAFDLKAPTFRHLQYDGYKATRHPMPDELAMQLPYMKDVLRAMHIPIFECEGWEADDVLGTVGRLCGEDGWECVIVTGDRDSLQLVDEHVHVKLITTKGGQTPALWVSISEAFKQKLPMRPGPTSSNAADTGVSAAFRMHYKNGTITSARFRDPARRGNAAVGPRLRGDQQTARGCHPAR